MMPACYRTNPLVGEAEVQVWSPVIGAEKPGSIVAFGILIDDGSLVLTYLYPGDYALGAPLDVITRDGSRLSATVHIIDPNTGLTLLKLVALTRLPAIAIRNISIPKYNQTVYVWGWAGSELTYNRLPAVVSADQAPRPLFFSIAYNVTLVKAPLIENKGAVVTDKNGNILGLVTAFPKTAMILGGPGTMPPIVCINNALKLLSADEG